MRFRRTSPDNPLPNYIAADDQFKAGNVTAARNELRAAMGKTTYDDFSAQKIAAREELYLASISDPLEARIRAVSGFSLEAVPAIRSAAKALLAIQTEAQATGDTGAALEAAQLGVDIGRAL